MAGPNRVRCSQSASLYLNKQPPFESCIEEGWRAGKVREMIRIDPVDIATEGTM